MVCYECRVCRDQCTLLLLPLQLLLLGKVEGRGEWEVDTFSEGLLRQRLVFSLDVSGEWGRGSVRDVKGIPHPHILHLVTRHRPHHVEDIKGMVDSEHL